MTEEDEARARHGRGLLAHAGTDVLRSMLAAREIVEAERAEPQTTCEPGGLGGDGGQPRLPMSLVSRMATRQDIDTALYEMEPPLLRPDMPLCFASDLITPKSFQEAKYGEFGEQFMDEVSRKVHGLLEAKAFDVAEE